MSASTPGSGMRTRDVLVTVADLWAFLAPGLVHALGNGLLSIRAGAHVLGEADGDSDRPRRVIEAGYAAAHEQLKLMHALGEGAPDLAAEPVEQVLERLRGPLGVALRGSGRTVTMSAGTAGEAGVPPAHLIRAILTLVLAAVRTVPAPGASRFVVNVAAEAPSLRVGLEALPEPGDGALPFSVDYDGLARVVDLAVAEVLPWASVEIRPDRVTKIELAIAPSNSSLQSPRSTNRLQE